MKRLMEEIDARERADVGKTVCSGCLIDYALQQAVRATGGSEPCDYCHQSPSAPEGSAPVELILDLIVDGFRYEYEDPVEQVLYSSADGGYQMGWDDPWDLLGNHEVTEMGISSRILRVLSSRRRGCSEIRTRRPRPTRSCGDGKLSENM